MTLGLIKYTKFRVNLEEKMRALVPALAILLAPAMAGAADPYSQYYYGPMSGGNGYKDKLTEDGFWEIEAGVNRQPRALAIDFAIYRAAEMAKSAGHRYVEIHDASQRRNRSETIESATLFARPVDSPIHPSTCRSGKPKRCYTADVALIFARLSGADGQHPGLAAPSYVDKFGRTVTESGFGTGAVGPRQQ